MTKYYISKTNSQIIKNIDGEWYSYHRYCSPSSFIPDEYPDWHHIIIRDPGIYILDGTLIPISEEEAFLEMI